MDAEQTEPVVIYVERSRVFVGSAVLFAGLTGLLLFLAVSEPALFAVRMQLTIPCGLITLALAAFSRRGATIDVSERTILRWSGFRGPLIKRRRTISEKGVILLTHIRNVGGGLDRYELVVKTGRKSKGRFRVSETHDGIAAHQRADIIAEALDLRIKERSVSGSRMHF